MIEIIISCFVGFPIRLQFLVYLEPSATFIPYGCIYDRFCFVVFSYRFFSPIYCVCKYTESSWLHLAAVTPARSPEYQMLHHFELSRTIGTGSGSNLFMGSRNVVVGQGMLPGGKIGSQETKSFGALGTLL
ncbi:hypothetical protein FRX31_034555 [Thalictrum thalictroides]|uniref:Uncharacterized protein n=1 Tax=Thalictrum thalictroides TaxID=46969 RepID=A0A7J6UTG3_THATH|nr:hypothetical protein FRX31_034555 [Thalictrum thalictroides]